MPESSRRYICRMSKSNKTVLFSLTVDVQQPPSVQLTLVPGILPWSGFIREQVLVAFLTVEIVPTWQ